MNAYNTSARLRLLFLSLISAFMLMLVGISSAGAVPGPVTPVGIWNVNGNIKIGVNLPTVLTSNTTLNTGVLGMKLTYGADNSFKSNLLGMSGTWAMTSRTAFAINLDSWVNSMVSTVKSLIPSATITIGTKSFTGKVVATNRMTGAATKLSGNFKMVINVSVPKGASLGGLVTLPQAVNGAISMTGTFTNTPVLLTSPQSPLGVDSATGQRLPIDVLNDIIGSAFYYQLLTQ
ncbi:MAG: hypothetical protein PHE55_06855 [Methylococcaceae bacterium]|nr:hypothetical protein [Methylococcaceae bacterium]